MNKPDNAMSQRSTSVNEKTQPQNESGEPNAGAKSRRLRVAQILGAAAVLGATVVLEAMAGPKLPKNLSE